MASGRHPLREEDFVSAEGSGAAALLLFASIAVIGYLAYCWWFLLDDRETWRTLALRPAAWQYYMIPWFGLLVFLPTDALTRLMGRVCQVVSLVSLVGFTAMGAAAIGQPGAGTMKGLLIAILVAAIPSILLKPSFALAMPVYRERFRKSFPIAAIMTAWALATVVAYFAAKDHCGLWIVLLLTCAVALFGTRGWMPSTAGERDDPADERESTAWKPESALSGFLGILSIWLISRQPVCAWADSMESLFAASALAGLLFFAFWGKKNHGKMRKPEEG